VRLKTHRKVRYAEFSLALWLSIAFTAQLSAKLTQHAKCKYPSSHKMQTGLNSAIDLRNHVGIAFFLALQNMQNLLQAIYSKQPQI